MQEILINRTLLDMFSFDKDKKEKKFLNPANFILLTIPQTSYFFIFLGKFFVNFGNGFFGDIKDAYQEIILIPRFKVTVLVNNRWISY